MEISDFTGKVKEGSEINPKDLLEMLFFQNFNFQYFRDISDSASKRQEYKHRVLEQEKLAALLLIIQKNTIQLLILPEVFSSST